MRRSRNLERGVWQRRKQWINLPNWPTMPAPTRPLLRFPVCWPPKTVLQYTDWYGHWIWCWPYQATSTYLSNRRRGVIWLWTGPSSSRYIYLLGVSTTNCLILCHQYQTSVEGYRSAIADKLGHLPINMRISLICWIASTQTDLWVLRASPPGTFPWCFTSSQRHKGVHFKEASLKHLTFKTVFVLALGSVVVIPAMDKSLKADRSQWPVSALHYYLDRTSGRTRSLPWSPSRKALTKISSLPLSSHGWSKQWSYAMNSQIRRPLPYIRLKPMMWGPLLLLRPSSQEFP